VPGWVLRGAYEYIVRVPAGPKISLPAAQYVAVEAEAEAEAEVRAE
jgi:hypothetical protein